MPTRSWVEDPGRCAAAGVAEQVGFATKPALTTARITAAPAAGVPAGWVARDEVYGADPNYAKPSGPPGWATCCRSRPTAGCPPAPGRSGSTPWPGCYPNVTFKLGNRTVLSRLVPPDVTRCQ